MTTSSTLVAAGHDPAIAADHPGDLGLGRDGGVSQTPPDERALRGVDGHVQLDDLHLAVGEDVGVARGGDAEDRRDGVRGLELRRDHEVDVDLTLPPGLEVGGAARADDRLRARHALGEHRAHEIRLLVRAAADEQVRLCHARLGHDVPARSVALDRAHVGAIRDGREPLPVNIDHRDVVLLVQRLDEGARDVTGAQHNDAHAASVMRRAGTRVLW
jgi:hypothetical protein